MNFEECKRQIFQNRPEVQKGYDALNAKYEDIRAGYNALGPRYNIIRAEKENPSEKGDFYP